MRNWVDDTAEAVLRDALRYLPDGEYRRYGGWLLDQPAYRRRWLQVLGVPALLQLTGALLAGLVSEAAMRRLITEYGPPLFGYLIWEAASDNLAIGLGHRSVTDSSYAERRVLVREFNDAMLARLRGETADVPGSERVSLLRQSLSESEHRALLAAYLAAVPGAGGHAIEFAVGPVLAANAAAAEHAVAAMRASPMGPLFRDGLERRYRAVNALLDGPPAEAEALRVGTDAILVAPTLAYLVGALAEVTGPLAGLPAGLPGALRQAGLLVRLLNDCGTAVIEQPDDERRELVSRLRRAGARRTVSEALLTVAGDGHDRMLARLVKDIRFGEFNVCLDGVRDLPAVAGLEEFRRRLERACQAYRRASRELRAATGDAIPGQIIERFVAFHRRMYSAAFDTEAGEYAIGGD
jgi:hypothetical protein